jgi:hypothetical protein
MAAVNAGPTEESNTGYLADVCAQAQLANTHCLRMFWSTRPRPCQAVSLQNSSFINVLHNHLNRSTNRFLQKTQFLSMSQSLRGAFAAKVYFV